MTRAHRESHYRRRVASCKERNPFGIKDRLPHIYSKGPLAGSGLSPRRQRFQDFHSGRCFQSERRPPGVFAHQKGGGAADAVSRHFGFAAVSIEETNMGVVGGTLWPREHKKSVRTNARMPLADGLSKAVEVAREVPVLRDNKVVAEPVQFCESDFQGLEHCSHLPVNEIIAVSYARKT